MKFRIGSLPVNQDFDPHAGNWIPCKEPKPWVSTWLISIPLSFLLAIIFTVMLFKLTPFDLQGLTPYKLVLLYIGVIVAHEAIHAVMQPDREHLRARRWASGRLIWSSTHTMTVNEAAPISCSAWSVLSCCFQ